MEQNFLQKVKEYDFFSENEEMFWNHCRDVETIMVQGQHRNPAPLVTILIPTYKRPELLEYALRSALEQNDFDDYQVIVVDNEGHDINQETETSKVVAKYESEKLIYYRHKESINFYKMDNAAKLAKSKYICFLHDDDLLVANHLNILGRIVLEHPQIKWLSPGYEDFYNEDFEYVKMVKPEERKCMMKSYSCKYIVGVAEQGWLGALIDREAYYSIGGMPSINTGIGDFIMQGKFAFHWDVYSCNGSVALYKYRRWSGQATATAGDQWNDLYCEQYFYQLYARRKVFKHFNAFWKRKTGYDLICNFLRGHNYSVYKWNKNLLTARENCGLGEKLEIDSLRYKLDMFIYKCIVKLLLLRSNPL